MGKVAERSGTASNPHNPFKVAPGLSYRAIFEMLLLWDKEPLH
jgi:hypothetical protein